MTPATLQTLVDNGQAVQAPGGLIILSAQAASGLLGGVVKNSGALSATGLVNDGGTIRLSASHKIELTPSSRISADAAPSSAGNGGRIDVIADLANATGITQVDGTISAKGGEQGGYGGFIETSATHLKIADAARVTTLAPRGQAGNWLLDPNDFEVSSTGNISGSTLSTLLASGNVTLQAGTGTDTSGTKFGNVSTTGTKGDINIYDAVSWSANSLTLNAGYNIHVGSSSATGSLTVTGSGSLNLNPSSSAVTGYTAGGAVLMGMATSPASGLTGGYLSAGSFGAGAATGFNGQINVSTSGTVKISNTSYSVINSEADFVGIASGGNYVMGSQLGFSTVYTAAVVASFGGKLNGFGHVISGLNINNPSASGFIGLFGSSNGNVSNLGVSGSIVGPSWVGAIAGYTNGLVIKRSYSTVAVTGAGGVGGLVGLAQPVTISESYSTGDVTGNTSNGGSMGGLVGFLYGGTINSSYATGAIRGVSGTGGLVGSMQNHSHITNSFATGDVIAMQSNKDSFGGLVGYVPNGDNKTISKSYATGAVRNNTGVTGTTYRGGLIGNLGTGTNVNIEDNYWNATANPSFDVSTGGMGNGTVFSGVSALTASQLKNASSFSSAFGNTAGSFTDASGWGFQAGVNGGFPVRCAISQCTAYDSSLFALTYNGASNGLWSIASNWVLSGTSTVASFAPTASNQGNISALTLSAGGVVNYDTANVGSLSVPIANAGTINFTGSSDVSIYGVISGSGALTKAGTGTITLSGANTYTGATTVSAGTLAISNATGLGSTAGGTTVASGATLNLQGVSVGGEAITLSGGTLATSTGTSSLSGAVTLGADSTINVAGAASQLTLSGLVTGASALTKSGTGNLIMANQNTFSGGLTIASGTATEATTYNGSSGPLGSGTVTVQTGATLDLNNYNIYAPVSLAGGALVNNATSGGVGQGDVSLGVSLTANSMMGGAGYLHAFTAISSNGYGLVFLGTGTKNLSNVNNTLSTIASGSGLGALNVVNNQALTIGQVAIAGNTYRGIDSTGTIAVSTRTGDLTVSQNVSTTSTSNNGNAPAINLRAGTLSAAGMVTGGDLVLSGSPSFSMGANALAVFYSGNPATFEATALISQLSAYSPFDKVYNRDSGSNIFGSGYWAAFRGAAPVTIYVLPVSGQSSTYGTAPTSLDYCYSSSSASCVNVSYSGIPSTSQSFALTSGALSGAVNVPTGVTGSLALTGSSSIAASGLVASTNAGTYTLSLTPSLTLPGYIFSAGNAVNYTVNRKSVNLTNIARTTTYDGVTTYAALANGISYAVNGLVGQDALASVTQTPSGHAGSALGVAQAGNFSVRPSGAVLSTGNVNNYNFIYGDSTHTVNPAPLSATLTGSSSKVYDGSTAVTLTAGNFALSGFANSEGASVSQTAGTLDTANVGTSKAVTAALGSSDFAANSGTQLSNYILPTSASGSMGSVTPAPLTVTAVTNTKSFDGNTEAQAVPVVSGLKVSDAVVNLREAYADANPGTGKTLSVQMGYQIVDGNNGNNYVVSLVPNQTGEIRALPVAILAPTLAVVPTANSAPPTLTVLASSSAGASSAGSAGGSSSAGVSVSTISSPTQQVTGLVAVLVPAGTATAGSGLVIALPEQVVTPAASGAAVKVTLPNSEPLPAWIRYDAATQTLVTSAVPAGAFPLSVVVTVGGQSTVVQISESPTGQ
ncbi:S-layer family protein [Limnohabitans sp. G3-2]|uniref:beta strand repeat-containing protein n=1 Tax=Limnohabitans sp. G3-2 TaxID=1100711 RepID=UPI001E60255B|nr:YDG domain-containing protein [Limnohabitans sp. G3-2]